MKNRVTVAWKVNGFFDGEVTHRQRESFCNSRKLFLEEADFIVLNADITKTNMYTIVIVTADDKSICERELDAQISDGIFENSSTGAIEEIADVEKLLNDYKEQIANLKVY